MRGEFISIYDTIFLHECFVEAQAAEFGVALLLEVLSFSAFVRTERCEIGVPELLKALNSFSF